jgi:hypothetical protein
VICYTPVGMNVVSAEDRTYCTRSCFGTPLQTDSSLPSDALLKYHKILILPVAQYYQNLLKQTNCNYASMNHPKLY